MVEPVVMISRIQSFRGVLSQTQKVGLSAVPKMIVGKSDVGRPLGIQGPVPLSLIGIATGLTIKKVAMMHPNVVVVLLQTNIVSLATVAVHGSKVSNLYITCILKSDAPAISNRIVAHALQRDITAGIVLIFHHHIPIQQIVRIGNLPNKTHD